MEEKRTMWLHLRLTKEEYTRIRKHFEQTHTGKISDYARAVLLGKPLIGSYRNRSMDDFVAEMIRLRTELNNIGNNFNQLVKKVHTYKDEKTIRQLLFSYEADRSALLRHIENIESLIEKSIAKW